MKTNSYYITAAITLWVTYILAGLETATMVGFSWIILGKVFGEDCK